MIQLSDKAVKILVERLVPFENLTDVGYGNVFCPFHENPKTSKSKSARFYFDEDGITRLQCWGCHRQYTSYDYIKSIMNTNPLKYLQNNFTEKEIKEYNKVIKEAGVLNNVMGEDLSDRIHNLWVDSNENIVTFLDSLYVGYKLEEV